MALHARFDSGSDVAVAPSRGRGTAAPPHLCFVAPQAWPVFARLPDVKVIGGAEVQQSILARALAGHGYRVSMICLDYGQPDLVVVDGVTVLKAHRPDGGLPMIRFIHPRLTSMWRALRRVDADIYYQRSSSMLTGVVAAFCRRHGRKSIYAAASDVDFQPGRQQIQLKRDKRLFEYGLRRVDAVIAQNRHQLESCSLNYGREATLIPSCYKPPQARSGEARDTVLWVGNIRDYKRPDLFLELARRMPDRRFVMIGGGAAGGYFDRICRESAALPNVEFPGFLPLEQVEPYFDRARAFVNTSVYEGMPNTFLQAWARGVPTVAFVDTGARLRNDPLYRVVERIEEAAAEIARLCADEVYWTGVSARCREYFQSTHSVDGVMAHYEGLIEGLMPAWRHAA